uniref:Uncharacterized protein n=1 Tax=Timema genevievae TaxID=629358 RepID=A0A7R9JXH9_TIMGE|nr:unnamed protein product [Timema genevievae]
MSHSVSKEQADQQLSESLLDPPPSLDLFARRYQSPSRCGSPSMEAPEYLMFGRGTRKQEGWTVVLQVRKMFCGERKVPQVVLVDMDWSVGGTPPSQMLALQIVFWSGAHPMSCLKRTR